MKIQLRVDVDGIHFRGGAIVEVPESMNYFFEGIDESDENELLCFSSKTFIEKIEVKKALRLRSEAAKEMAEALTSLILSEMSKNDTYNGYKK